jgi:hypothetical protein
MTTVIGVISDTHGLLRPEAVAALEGSALIVHAGDIGSADVLEHLRALAPVVAVRGNNDTDSWARSLPEVLDIDVAQFRVHVLHDVKTLTRDPIAAGIDVVIAGHSHRPAIRWQGSVLFLNPGSAGPRRFSLPVTVARIHVDGPTLAPEVVPLLSAPATPAPAPPDATPADAGRPAPSRRPLLARARRRNRS